MDYREYGFGESYGFISTTKQICNEIDDFRLTAKAAIDRNTEQIKIENEENRKNFTNLFGALRQTFLRIFTKNGSDDSDNMTFYDMVQKENDDTQNAIAKHQENLSQTLVADTKTIEAAIKENTNGNKVNVTNLITSLNSIKDGQAEIKEAIISDTKTIEAAIKANTSEGKVNVNTLITSLNSLRTGQTEIKDAIGRIERI